MSGAAAYLARLHAAVQITLISPHAAVALRRHAAAVDSSQDMGDAIDAIVPLILAAENAADQLAIDAKRMRAALAEVMAESGATTHRGGPHHIATVSDGRAGVVITDPAAIPADLMRQPPPAPDKAAIAKLLKEGRPVPGAVLGNGSPQLTIRSKDR